MVGNTLVASPSTRFARTTSLGSLGRWIVGLLNLYKRREDLSRCLLDVGVQAVPVRVHCDDRREIADLEVPHRLGRAELGERDAVHALDAPGVELRRATDAVEIDR